MAGHKINDGAVTIAKGVLNAIKKAGLGSTARAIVDHVIGGTWGQAVPTKKAQFRVREIAAAIGASAKVVGERIRFLVKANVLVETATLERGVRVLGFQKYEEKWQLAEVARERRAKKPRQKDLFATADETDVDNRLGMASRNTIPTGQLPARDGVDHHHPARVSPHDESSQPKATKPEAISEASGAPRATHARHRVGSDDVKADVVPTSPRAPAKGSGRVGSFQENFFVGFFETAALGKKWSRHLKDLLAGSFPGREQTVADKIAAIARANAPKVGVTPQAYATGMLKGKLLHATAADAVEAVKGERRKEAAVARARGDPAGEERGGGPATVGAELEKFMASLGAAS